MQCPQCHHIVTRDMASCPHCHCLLAKRPIERVPSQPLPTPHLDELVGGAMPRQDERDDGAQGAVPVIVPLPQGPNPGPVARLWQAARHGVVAKVGGAAAVLLVASGTLVGLMASHNGAPPRITSPNSSHQGAATVTGAPSTATVTANGTPGLTPTDGSGTGTPGATATPNATGTPTISPTPEVDPMPTGSPCPAIFSQAACGSP